MMFWFYTLRHKGKWLGSGGAKTLKDAKRMAEQLILYFGDDYPANELNVTIERKEVVAKRD